MVDGLTEQSGGAGESLGGFAKLLGVSKQAVSKAIARGRLKHSVGRDAKGRPVIANVALAHQEWSANAARPVKGGAAATRRADRPAAPNLQPPTSHDPDSADEDLSPAEDAVDPLDALADLQLPTRVKNLADAQLIATIERAKTIRLDRDVKTGRLVEKDAVVRQQFEAMRIVREAVLNLPARFSAEFAAETDPAKLYTKFDQVVREALGLAAEQLRTQAGDA